jgi:epoxyqueuosine reductase QueG
MNKTIMATMSEIQKMADDLGEPKKFIAHAKKPQTFEDFLQDIHAAGYHGTDDDMPDAYEHWVCSLDGQEIMDYAQAWGETLV